MSNAAEYGVRRTGSSAGRTVRRSQETGEVSRRILLGLIVGLVPLAAVSLILVFPAMRISRLEIVGDTTLGREEILQWAALHSAEYLATVDCQRIAANIEAHPQVAAAEVSRLFPNGLRVSVTDRKAVAAVLATVDGRAVPVGVDREGVAFRALPEGGDVPILSGIRFEGFRYGVHLPDSLLPVLRSLETLREAGPELLSAFSELRLVRRPYGELELLLYPLHYRVPVRTPLVLNVDLLRSIILVLDVVENQGLSSTISELDFRTGTVVYRVKEGLSG